MAENGKIHAPSSPAPADAGIGREHIGGEDEYLRLLENLRGEYFVYRHDVNGVFIYLSPSIEDILGYSPEEFKKHYTTYLTDNPVNEEVQRRTDASIRGEKQPSYLVEIYHKNGSRHWLEVLETPVFGADGKVKAVEGLAHDITERKRQEKRLIILSRAFESSLDPIVITDTKGMIKYCNPAAVELYGEVVGDIVGRHVSTLDSNPQFVREVILPAIQAAGGWTGEVLSRRKDGTFFPAHISTTAIRGADGGMIGMLGIVRDITGKKKAEDDLQKANELLESRVKERTEMLEDANRILSGEIEERLRTEKKLVEQGLRLQEAHRLAHIGSWSYDAKTGAMSWSDEMLLIAGRSPELPPPADGEYEKFFRPESWKRLIATAKETVSTGRSCELELELVRPDGEVRKVVCRGKAERDSKGGIIRMFGTLQDVTERKLLEEQYRQSQKMEAIGRLAGGVAHDFNNMLSVILGNVELALHRIAVDDPLRIELEEVEKAGDHAAKLTRQLLAFGRKQVLKPEVLNLNALIEKMGKMLRLIIGEDIELCVSVADDLRMIKADVGQFEQVIMNLAINARDSMPSGGKLEIRTENIGSDADDRCPEMGPGAYVKLSVIDSGCGMDEETRKHLFEPFFTTKHGSGGTGLGLATVYGIVRQSGGNIQVFSEPGRGTVFSICLPCADGKPADKAEIPHSGRFPGGHETVLVVEDEEMVRRMTRLVLSSAGYNVLSAANGHEAFLLCKETDAEIHLMLTDVVMPGMNGCELAAHVSKLRPDIKVIYMSGHTDNAVVCDGILDKRLHFIGKPFTLGELTRKVREVLDLRE